MQDYDFVIVGAGIASASAAYELAAHGSVLILERESQPAYHTTGRSAALFIETYGPPAIQALTVGSRAFYLAPPPGFTEHPLLSPRGVLLIARAERMEALAAYAEASRKVVPDLQEIDGEAARRLVPVLRTDYVAGAVLEPPGMDIDVNGLLQGFLRGARARGARLMTDAEVTGIARDANGWRVETSAGEFRAATLINASGAWGDKIAEMAGVTPVGLVPKRRTALTFAPPPGSNIAVWPAVVDVDETFYFKPEAGRLLASPADETPFEPCDVQPDEMDIAICIDRVQQAADLPVTRVERSWAGLRSFVADKTPVVGFDKGAPGFFWLVGQGGYGIQTAPALGRVVGSLARGLPMPPDLRIVISDLAPERLRP